MIAPPLTLRQLAPMLERPAPPEPGERIQLGHYFVEARRCSCCQEPITRYFLRNVNGDLLAGGRNWARMCHYLGVYELPSDELWPEPRPATLKKVAPSAASTSHPVCQTSPTGKVGAEERPSPKQEELF